MPALLLEDGISGAGHLVWTSSPGADVVELILQQRSRLLNPTE